MAEVLRDAVLPPTKPHVFNPKVPPMAFRDNLAGGRHWNHERGHLTDHGEPLPDVCTGLADQRN